MIGTATAAASNAEVSSHSVLVVELPMSRAISGSTGTSIDRVMDTIKPPVATAASAATSLGRQWSASGWAGRAAQTFSPGALAGGSSIIAPFRPTAARCQRVTLWI